ncbi:MAG: VanZ family protein [Gammaproteobacteria bacterium]|nr:VanZ family protein [Gammaproteobacteria bacterium]MCB1922370.1 VanZ family protein [Gammaproteobacteria bacterium]
MSISRCNCAGFRLLLGFALCVVTWLALTPHPPALPPVAFADKLGHLSAFVVLALLADLSWPEHRFGFAKWGTLLLYGLAIELLQTQVANRYFELADLAADALGLALYGLLLVRGMRSLGWR